MKIAEFARLIGVNKEAVRKACGNGRLSRSVRRDERGRVIDIDREVGAREWESNRAKPPPITAGSGRALPTADVQRLVSRLVEVCEVLQADEREIVAGALPHAVAAASDALRSAGYEATPEQIVEALALDEGADGWGSSWIVGTLLRAIGDEEASRSRNREVARRAAREAVEEWVNGRRGARDGREG